MHLNLELESRRSLPPPFHLSPFPRGYVNSIKWNLGRLNSDRRGTSQGLASILKLPVHWQLLAASLPSTQLRYLTYEDAFTNFSTPASFIRLGPILI
ncbi:hypothetical protein PAXINDRAFT_171447 [Paxillus involutus ATCC 200175]|uniref:Uncharacterized protein n=1 Tax=Paxillus involutus ATCC 200175 TaxID=664439 RepID=A0A0C9TNB9_PAXIN|nr:hypothetical protein PAXINDRAFT_171447 [Paxillus involutus ATCC 200175]